MRLIATILFTAMLVLGVWTFIDADNHGWWLPPNVASYGGQIDDLFYLILWMVAFFFVATEAVLIYCIAFYTGKRGGTKATFTHGNHKLEMIWTAIPALLLLFIAFAQMKTWAQVKFPSSYPSGGPIAEVYASQFDWRFRYPGDDGKFGTMDDIENPFEFVVPVNEKVTFNLRSRDVIHSFFVPLFRLKQDAMPGMTIPVWFEAQKTGDYDLVCAELCGWGHYKMAGRVRVVTRAEYDAWLQRAKHEMFSNGKEDKS